jgi:aminoglycoside 6-adenylyltransferase
MHREQDLLQLILDTARQDERVRAVILQGSRANPHAPRDIFQDFDIVYLVTEVAPFKNDRDWIKRFGEIMILQLPDDMQDPPPGADGGFTYLMQFTDGQRIDLGIYPLAKVHEIASDSLSVLLLDKDGAIGPLPSPSERDYLPRPPTAKAFTDCCNEFWWVCPYVAKGLWRAEILYAKHMLEVVREQLMKMLIWHIGVRTQFSRNPGKFGKYFRQYLEPEWWDLLQQTYADAGYANTWEALFKMCALFREAALTVAGHFGYEYPYGDDARVSAHLAHVRALPRDAKEIY